MTATTATPDWQDGWHEGRAVGVMEGFERGYTAGVEALQALTAKDRAFLLNMIAREIRRAKRSRGAVASPRDSSRPRRTGTPTPRASFT